MQQQTEEVFTYEDAQNMYSDREDRRIEFQQSQSHSVRQQLPVSLRTVPLKDLLERIEAEELRRVVYTYSPDRNLLMLGRTGTGKTTAAAIIFRRLLSQGAKGTEEEWRRARAVFWVHAADLGSARRRHPLGQGEPEEIEEARNCRLLYLDDAGWEQDVSAVSEVLEARYRDGAHSVITTGLTRDELTARYGAAVVRRIREAGGKSGVVVDLFRPTGQKGGE